MLFGMAPRSRSQLSNTSVCCSRSLSHLSSSHLGSSGCLASAGRPRRMASTTSPICNGGTATMVVERGAEVCAAHCVETRHGGARRCAHCGRGAGSMGAQRCSGKAAGLVRAGHVGVRTPRLVPMHPAARAGVRRTAWAGVRHTAERREAPRWRPVQADGAAAGACAPPCERVGVRTPRPSRVRRTAWADLRRTERAGAGNVEAPRRLPRAAVGAHKTAVRAAVRGRRRTVGGTPTARPEGFLLAF